MDRARGFVATTVLLGLIAIIHAAFTWPVTAVVALFGGGAAIAFVAEASVITLGWLEHHVGRSVSGVPVYVLFGWVAVIYVAFRVALLITTGIPAVAIAAVLATAYDVLTDYRGVEAGYWTYTDDRPGPRFRGVPWWNYLGWLVISALTTLITLSVL